MFCPSCGKELDASDAFCRYCGRSITTVHLPTFEDLKQTSPRELQQVNVRQDQNGPISINNPYRGKVLQLVGAAIFVICFIGCGASLNGDSQNGSLWLLGAAAGLIMYVVGRFLHWWYWE